MYGLSERLSSIFTSLRQNNPSSSGVFNHELRDIVYLVLYYYPAIPNLIVLADLLPAECRHQYKVINNENNSIVKDLLPFGI
jgi:hypothetical protein